MADKKAIKGKKRQSEEVTEAVHEMGDLRPVRPSVHGETAASPSTGTARHGWEKVTAGAAE